MATKRTPASRNVPEDGAAIIRRQLLILLGLLLAGGLVWGVWSLGEDRGWGNQDRAVKTKMEKAQQAFVSRNMDSAIAYYNQIITRYPGHPLASQALTGLATAYEESKRLDLAIQTYQRLLGQLGDNPAKSDLRAFTQLQIGKLWSEKSDYDQAIHNFQTVQASFPKTDWAGEAMDGIGRAYQARSDYSGAIKAFQRVIKEYPKGFLAAEAQTAIGECYEAQQKFGQALKAYQVILKEYPAAVWDEAKAKLDALKEKMDSQNAGRGSNS